MMRDQAELSTVVPGWIWCVQQWIRTGPLSLRARMTIVRRPGGGLWVHSPVEPTTQVLAWIKALGRVDDIVAPNRFHHRFFASFHRAEPQARGWIAPGLDIKRPDLKRFDLITPDVSWGDDLAACFIHGLPTLNETVWFHRPSQTLIVTDLLFCFGEDNPAPTRLAGHLLGVQGRLAMSRSMRWMVKDRQRFARSVDQMLAWQPRRLVLAHDRLLERDVMVDLQRAFAWVYGRVDPPT